MIFYASCLSRSSKFGWPLEEVHPFRAFIPGTEARHHRIYTHIHRGTRVCVCFFLFFSFSFFLTKCLITRELTRERQTSRLLSPRTLHAFLRDSLTLNVVAIVIRSWTFIVTDKFRSDFVRNSFLFKQSFILEERFYFQNLRNFYPK